MGKFLLLTFSVLIFSFHSKAQLTENFSDGDFTSNPAWAGDVADFIVNANLQLQSNNQVANSNFYLSTPSTKATEAVWEFYTNLTFNTSSTNYVDVYVTASAADLAANSTSGYVIRIGGTADEVCLYKKSNTGVFTKIIDGADGVTNSSNNTLKIKLIRTVANQWILATDVTGTGNQYITETPVTDATYNTSAFFGINIKQSTASFFQRHFFDDFSITTYVPDVTPPAIVSATAVFANRVDVLFNEPVTAASGQLLTNYSASNGLGNPTAAQLDATNPALVHLTFAANFPSGAAVTLTVNNVADISGNVQTNGTINFTFTATPPQLLSAIALSTNNVDVLFNEPVTTVTAQILTNYSAGSGLGNPATAIIDPTNKALVHLSFTGSFANATIYHLTVSNVTDLEGTPIVTANIPFSFYTAGIYDVVINEIMADPAPVVALPNSEWIELKNTTGFTINLLGWRLADESGTSGPLPNYNLKADSFVVVCAASSLPALSAYGPALSVTSFPSLNDAGENLTLFNGNGIAIHNVNYNIAWYQNELKKNGGWTLEMIDSKNPCSGANNWIASTDVRGGTPAEKNAAAANNPDTKAPAVLYAFASDPLHVRVVFTEGLTLNSAQLNNAYNINNGIGVPLSAVAVTPQYNSVVLTLATALQAGTIYTLTVSNVKDCSGNNLTSGTTRLSLTQNINPFDVVVNEILFNPIPSGVDYVEIYNRSNKTVNLKNISIANRNTSGIVSSIYSINNQDQPFFPGDYFVVTTNAAFVKNNYVVQNPAQILEIPSMPSYNDDKGNVIILNEQGIIVDEIKYTDKWHYELLSNKEAVALERINYNDTSLLASEQQKNWHSAASSAGYGTPTYKNSQFLINDQVQGTISVTPEVISPNNDGMDDFATIQYQFPEPGYVATITVFDAVGRPVKYLQRNALNGTSGYYRWDGLDDKKRKVPSGIYVIYTEVFNLAGKTKRFKNVIVVSSKP